MKTPLTAKQAAFYAYLRNYLIENHGLPTFREMATHFGVSLNCVANYIQYLVKKGWLVQVSGRYRF